MFQPTLYDAEDAAQASERITAGVSEPDDYQQSLWILNSVMAAYLDHRAVTFTRRQFYEALDIARHAPPIDPETPQLKRKTRHEF